MSVDTFPALEKIPNIASGFTTRIPGVDVATEREEALRRLGKIHRSILEQRGLGRFVTAQQTHSSDVARVDRETQPLPVPDTDGLMTNEPGVTLGIYVADCAAVFFVDPKRRAIALVHSGRKGTELGIVPATIEKLKTEYGSDPADIILQIAPCIRPPHYETDFAAEIIRQAKTSGVKNIHDSGICTGANVEQYYSYRLEKGKTGRMLAFLALVNS